MSEIKPGFGPHRELESEVKEFLHSKGFLTGDLTYHTKLPRKISRVLQRRYGPTALYLRGRADRLAIHKFRSIEFEWEIKTHDNENKHDCLLEALPLIHHLSKAKLDVKCLYIFKNPYMGYECAFWVSDMPSMRVSWIPSNGWSEMQKDWFRGHLKEWFSIDLVEKPIYRGSRDPFVIIDESEIKKLPHWQTVINDLIPQCNIAIFNH